MPPNPNPTPMPKPNHPNPNQVARMMRDTNNDDPTAAVQATLALPLTLASPLPQPCLSPDLIPKPTPNRGAGAPGRR